MENLPGLFFYPLSPGFHIEGPGMDGRFPAGKKARGDDTRKFKNIQANGPIALLVENSTDVENIFSGG